MSNEKVPMAMARIPCGLFVMTATHDAVRSGVMARGVQQCSEKPPMVMVALCKGLPIEPLVRDSRFFALCQIAADDRFLQRKFAVTPDRGDDPFDSISVRPASSGAPIIERAMSYLECELVRHVDLDSDYRLFVGQVHAGGVLREVAPAVVYGDTG